MKPELQVAAQAIRDVTITVGDTTVKLCVERMYRNVAEQLSRQLGQPGNSAGIAMTSMLVIHNGDTKVAADVIRELNDQVKAQCKALKDADPLTVQDFAPMLTASFAANTLAGADGAVKEEMADYITASLAMTIANKMGFLRDLIDAKE